MRAHAAMIGLVALAAAAAHLAHARLHGVELPLPAAIEETFPSEEALELLSLGHAALVADYYWLRAINHFGTKEMHEHGYPNLGPLIERVLSLDPHFAAAYAFAGTALTVQGIDLEISKRLLLQGMRFRPDDWRIPFFLGFNAYYFGKDYPLAAWAMSEAAKIPGAPEIAGQLATRLAAAAGQPEVGLGLVDTVLETVDDPQLLELYRERRRLLELELEMKWLNQAADRFAASQGRRPATIAELVGPGLMRTLPDRDPLGGEYYLSGDGVVQTTSEERRLRLPGGTPAVLRPPDNSEPVP